MTSQSRGEVLDMIAKNGNRMPAHPGDFVRSEVIQPLGLSVTDAAQVLGVTRPALSKFLNGRVHLSSEMALRIEKAFSTPMETLMKMQSSYDIALARRKESKIRVLPFNGRSPHSAMKSVS